MPGFIELLIYIVPKLIEFCFLFLLIIFIIRAIFLPTRSTGVYLAVKDLWCLWCR